MLADGDVVALPVPGWMRPPIGTMVAKLRGPRVRAAYRRIGGGSPILDITLAQAGLLEAELRRRGHDATVAVAMRYTQPDTRAAVGRLITAGAQRLVLLPLYPHYSFATTGSSEMELLRAISEMGPDLPLTVVRTWHDHPSYLDLQTRVVAETVDDLPPRERTGAAVVFSAHGLPRSLVRRGDPYPAEIERTVAAIVDRSPHPIHARIGFQSRSGPLGWIGPGTGEVIADLGREGREHVVVVPISFVSDHLETLHEADIVLREIAVRSGIEHFHRVPVLNDRPEVGPMLADIVERS
ncbi:MAG: ferrochelatase [Acidimicrobiales bacterium]